MKIKTSELSGKPLDWLITRLWIQQREEAGEYVKPWWKDQVMTKFHADPYSTEWMWGGPIIDQAGIMFERAYKGHGPIGIRAYRSETGTSGPHGIAQDRLIAAMRCFIAWKLGDVVDVPEELCS